MQAPFSLENKNIIITGASSGIGKECAIQCSKAGANIILVARSRELLNSTLKLLSLGNHLTYPADVTNFSDLEFIISDATHKVGKLSGFIHSAGIEMPIPLKMLKPDNYIKVLSVNLISGFEIARILSNKKYYNEKGCSMVFIASIMSVVGQIGVASYCASKGAVVAGSKALALELAARKIRVNCVSPAVVSTEMTKALFEKLPEEAINEIYKMHPLGIGKPEDVAYACIFLLSDASKWITGTNLIIDGGYTAK